jgi:hypothetical protein
MNNYGVDMLVAERHAHYLAEAERSRVAARACGETGLPTGLRRAGRFVKQIWALLGPAATQRRGARFVVQSSTVIGT